MPTFLGEEEKDCMAWYNPIKKFVAFKCSFHVKALLMWWYQRTHKEVSTIELQICIGIYVDKKTFKVTLVVFEEITNLVPFLVR